jgi:hypothetical protein
MIHSEEVWEYFSSTQKDLIQEGNYLMTMVSKQGYQFKDYSFLVFPYAKAYEGFLKQLFLDVGFISHLDYISDHFRLGKFLSPHLIVKLDGRSLYLKIQQQSGDELAEKIWGVWKKERNEIFHYYPHNIKRVTYEAAESMNEEILHTMIEAYQALKKRDR